MSDNQTKSKKRVRDHGEVFTAEREVKAMCDLVKDETERIDSRFLEPACGNGNFLAEILTRKLATVKKLYKSNVRLKKRHKSFPHLKHRENYIYQLTWLYSRYRYNIL